MALNNAVMTNEAFQAIIDEYGDRIKCIKCACKTLFFNMPLTNNQFTIDQIKMKTVGMIDYFEVPQFNTANGKTYTSVIPTESIGEVIVADSPNDPIDIYRI